MNLQRCDRGHFYDADKFARCPHCEAGTGVVSPSGAYSPVNPAQSTVAFDPTVPFGVPAPAPTPAPAPQAPLEDGKTVSFFAGLKTPSEPVAGWLVCVKGAHLGADYRLKTGRNFIGRSGDNDVCLTGETSVSRSKHAIVIYEPKQNVFLAQPGEASELFYVNGSVVLSAVELKKNDRLQVGSAELMLIPCCDDTFAWEIDSPHK